MANTAITPTRMVLNQLKGRLKTARRGHKLLKDKRDELMRQFLDNVRLNKQLRTKVEQGLTEAFGSLSVASAIMSPEMLEQSLLYPRQSVELGMTYQNIMSVNVPVYDFQTRNSDPSEIFPYGFAQTSGELDDALEKLAEVFKDMLELAQVEKTTQMLAQEIEKTRRRVNALEYVMIPELEQNIRYISMKLDENEKELLEHCIVQMETETGLDRNAVTRYIEDHNVQTRLLFSGNLIKHPCFDQIRGTDAYRVAGELTNTDFIMNNTFWVGVYPGMTDEMIDYMAKIIIEAVNQ